MSKEQIEEKQRIKSTPLRVLFYMCIKGIRVNVTALDVHKRLRKITASKLFPT
jgi:hypothetical protein